MKVGVFDSGVGGLTVLNKLVSKYPNNEYIYYGDTKNVPYGNKNCEELEKLASNIIDFLIKKGVDIIIIACGTVSSNVKDILEKKYNIKMIDIISPTVEYVNNSDYKKIGVIATPSTVNSGTFNKRCIKDVIQVPCKQFVPLIESNNLEGTKAYYNEYLSNLFDRDLIILGCTHYPIIKEYLKEYLNIPLLDMADCIKNVFVNDSKRRVDLYFSVIDANILSNIKNILKANVDSINLAT